MLGVMAFEVYQLDVIRIERYARIVDIIIVQRYDMMPDYIMLAKYRLTASSTSDISIFISALTDEYRPEREPFLGLVEVAKRAHFYISLMNAPG